MTGPEAAAPSGTAAAGSRPARAPWFEDPRLSLEGLTPGQRYTALVVILLGTVMLRFGIPHDGGTTGPAPPVPAVAGALGGSTGGSTGPAGAPSSSTTTGTASSDPGVTDPSVAPPAPDPAPVPAADAPAPAPAPGSGAAPAPAVGPASATPGSPAGGASPAPAPASPAPSGGSGGSPPKPSPPSCATGSVPVIGSMTCSTP